MTEESSHKGRKKRDKQLDMQVLHILQNNGIFNNIQARACANVAEALKGSDLPQLRFQKALRQGHDNDIARFLVIEYLTYHGMKETLRCIQTETNSRFKHSTDKTIVARDLDVTDGELTLTTLLHSWDAACVDSNLAILKKDVKERLDLLPRKRGKKPPLPPKNLRTTTSDRTSLGPSEVSTPLVMSQRGSGRQSIGGANEDDLDNFDQTKCEFRSNHKKFRPKSVDEFESDDSRASPRHVSTKPSDSESDGLGNL